MLSTRNGGLIVKLNKALYGLKESGYLWYEDVRKSLVDLGFTVSADDDCLFKKTDDTGVIFITIHVDDFLVSSSSESLLIITKDALEKKYGKLKTQSGSSLTYLSIRIKKSNNIITLDQCEYIKELIEYYHIEKDEMTPYDDNLYKDEGKEVDPTKYKSLIAKINFIATRTRMEISFPISYLSSKCTKPLVSHWNALKKILGYLKRTIHWNLTFKQMNDNKNINIYMYVDASHILYKDSYGQTGYCIYLGEHLACIYGRSIKQKLVCHSSFAAEAIAMDTGTSSLERIINVVRFMGYNPQVIIREDNLPLLNVLASDYAYTEDSRAINNRIECTKQRIKEYGMKLEKWSTSDMIADPLTKVISVKEGFITYTKRMLNC